jgi:hypothetical protein
MQQATAMKDNVANDWTYSTIDQEVAKRVRGWTYNKERDAWVGDKGPEKLISLSQITGRWSSSTDSALSELEGLATHIRGFRVVLEQRASPPGPNDFVCRVFGEDGLLYEAAEGTLALAILTCLLCLTVRFAATR